MFFVCHVWKNLEFPRFVFYWTFWSHLSYKVPEFLPGINVLKQNNVVTEIFSNQSICLISNIWIWLTEYFLGKFAETKDSMSELTLNWFKNRILYIYYNRHVFIIQPITQTFSQTCFKNVNKGKSLLVRIVDRRKKLHAEDRWDNTFWSMSYCFTTLTPLKGGGPFLP